MIQFHPDIHLLTEFSAGCMPESIALCVASHLEHCDSCRHEIDQLNAFGSLFIYKESAHIEVNKNNTAMKDIHPSHTSNTELPEKLLKALEVAEENMHDLTDQELPTLKHARIEPETPTTKQTETLPLCLKKLVPNSLNQLNWKKAGSSVSVARLKTGDTQREVALHRLKPGNGVAKHDHRGQEITVVLSGSFSDQQGLYLPGDFIVKNTGDKHSPMASACSECICLTVVDAPIKFTGLFHRFLNPFLKLHTSAKT